MAGTVIAVALAAAGCGDDGGEVTAATSSAATTAPVPATSSAATTAPVPATSPATSSAVTTAPTTASTTTTSTTTTRPRPRVVLEADGLGVVAFGTAKAAAVSALTDALGIPGTESEAACPQWGPGSSTVRFNNLRANFRGGSFAGWQYGRPAPSLGLRTAAGTDETATIGALRTAYPGGVVVSAIRALGPDNVSLATARGLIYAGTTGTADDARVLDYWAGVATCE